MLMRTDGRTEAIEFVFVIGQTKHFNDIFILAPKTVSQNISNFGKFFILTRNNLSFFTLNEIDWQK